MIFLTRIDQTTIIERFKENSFFNVSDFFIN